MKKKAKTRKKTKTKTYFLSPNSVPFSFQQAYFKREKYYV